MGNCLQAIETENVDLIHSDNDSSSMGGSTSPSVTSGLASVSRQDADTDFSGSARSFRTPLRINSEEHTYQRRSHLPPAYSHRLSLPTYEETSTQRSAADVDRSSYPPTGLPVYHLAPGVTRKASELTEEEQIKIAQRIGLIQHLPIDIFVEGHKTDTECIICMADFMDGDQIRFLPCMHAYHVDCIDEWLLRSFSCPSCLEPVDSALLTSYDQLTALTCASAGTHSLNKQLEQLTAVSSPPKQSFIPVITTPATQ